MSGVQLVQCSAGLPLSWLPVCTSFCLIANNSAEVRTSHSGRLSAASQALSVSAIVWS
jgi:hypothetical protein